MEPQQVFGQSSKVKVAWICHFTDEEIQNRLPLWKKSAPFGAWIRNTLEGFLNSEEFEIHVIAPHQYLKNNFSFEEKGVFYHFFKVGIPIINRSWPAFFNLDLLTNFYFNRRSIKAIIKKIKPSLINLQGAENAYYSSSALDLYKEYPLLVTIQGFVGLEINTRGNKTIENRIKIENEILKNCSYFGGDDDSKRVISSLRNGDFQFYNYLYPLGSSVAPYMNKIVDKKFDFLFWGRICKDKGAEDFLQIIQQLKQRFPTIKACLIGPISNDYQLHLKNIANELDIFENLTFVGFVEKVSDLYNLVLSCKTIITPTYNDRLPTVLREAVFMKLAVISYKTGSIPEFNRDDENILLSEQGDIGSIVLHATKLLENERFYAELVAKAYKYGVNEFGVENNCKKMKNAYKDILTKTQIDINHV